LEGAESAFVVLLSNAPQSPVVVAIVPADNTTSVINTQLTFDDGDWYSPKNVLIKPTRDFLLLDSPYNAPLHLSVSSASNVSNVLMQILVQNSDRGAQHIILNRFGLQNRDERVFPVQGICSDA
jgi:hypothetical protein